MPASQASWLLSRAARDAWLQKVLAVRSEWPEARATLQVANVAKDIIFDNVSRKKMQDGINKLADAVGVTLGPRGPPPAPALRQQVHSRVPSWPQALWSEQTPKRRGPRRSYKRTRDSSVAGTFGQVCGVAELRRARLARCALLQPDSGDTVPVAAAPQLPSAGDAHTCPCLGGEHTALLL